MRNFLYRIKSHNLYSIKFSAINNLKNGQNYRSGFSG